MVLIPSLVVVLCSDEATFLTAPSRRPRRRRRQHRHLSAPPNALSLLGSPILLQLKVRSQRHVQAESSTLLASKILNLPLLLHITVGIEKALGFLKSTRICSRTWHLERNERLEDEELDF